MHSTAHLPLTLTLRLDFVCPLVPLATTRTFSLFQMALSIIFVKMSAQLHWVALIYLATIQLINALIIALLAEAMPISPVISAWEYATALLCSK